ncbi:hypothetical protein J2X69_001055 [Algoriphagus sp. 4150]|uniref:hypothetical protein n=1 Tax=Algoriphagus sp. 4150 TaxID=2817756 RepID=UPI00285DB90A|nr:hypothetical protein [Algoriphagus sp. 4150]MDR7128723.1 hypothetical protein [Algoriphagus sp. 4150]
MRKKSYDRSDKELDDILRKIADSAEIPFSEEDWGDMQARLDQISAPSPSWLGSKGLGWAGAILLSSMISLSIWNSHQEKQDTDQNLNAYETQNNLSSLNSGDSEWSEETQALDHSGQKDVRQAIPDAGNKSSGSSLKHSQTNTQIQNSAGTVEAVHASKKGQISTAGRTSSLPIISGFKNPENTPLIWEINQTPLVDLGASPLQKNASQSSEIEETNKNQEEVKEKRDKQFAGKFNVSLQAAPDLSGIKLNQVGKAGRAIGIGAEYFLRPKISIASGVFYSFKPYSANDGYQLSYGDQPDRVIGECDILDIPLNLRFYPIEGKLQRFFASAGLSTYLMLKEHYKLEYRNTQTGYPYSHELDFSGANNHFFGVVNFSVGYERKLGNKLSVQVEPYFKVPITGVGEGDISLKSTGLFVGLKFYPNLPKR